MCAGKIPEFLIRPWSEDTACLHFICMSLTCFAAVKTAQQASKKKLFSPVLFLTDMPVPLLELEKNNQPAFHPRCVERVINSSWALASPPPLLICNWMQQRLLKKRVSFSVLGAWDHIQLKKNQRNKNGGWRGCVAQLEI